MKITAPALSVLVPTMAYAAESGAYEYSFFYSFIQMVLSLAVVIGLILLSWYFSTRLFKGLPQNRFSSRHIRLVETRFVGPKKSLVLVEVGGEYLLFSASEQSLDFVRKIDLIEDIEIIEEQSAIPYSRLTSLFRKS